MMRSVHRKIPARKLTHTPLSAGGPPRSILPETTRGIEGVMRTIRGRPERRAYASGNRGFWRSPPAVQSAISRGNKKYRGVDS